MLYRVLTNVENSQYIHRSMYSLSTVAGRVVHTNVAINEIQSTFCSYSMSFEDFLFINKD